MSNITEQEMEIIKERRKKLQYGADCGMIIYRNGRLVVATN